MLMCHIQIFLQPPLWFHKWSLLHQTLRQKIARSRKESIQNETCCHWIPQPHSLQFPKSRHPSLQKKGLEHLSNPMCMWEPNEMDRKWTESPTWVDSCG
jgi:hypothetical protein